MFDNDGFPYVGFLQECTQCKNDFHRPLLKLENKEVYLCTQCIDQRLRPTTPYIKPNPINIKEDSDDKGVIMVLYILLNWFRRC